MPADPAASTGPAAAPADATTARAEAFILRLGRALHEAGAPAHRIEDAMAHLAPRVGVTGQFFTTPTSIFASFGSPESQRTALLRVEPSAVNLERMSQLDALSDAVERGHLGLAEAAHRLDALDRAPARYGAALSIASYGLASACVARFLGGGGPEILAAAAIGLMTGVLAELAGRSAAAGRAFDWLAPLAAAFAALGWAWWLGPMVPAIAALAGLIVLVPGLTLTVALSELASRNLVSGVARLAGAGLSFLAIGFGLALGARLAPALGGRVVAAPVAPLPPWTEGAALALSPLALTVLFRARPRDLGVIFAAGVIAYAVARAGAGLGGAEVGMLLAAFLVGVLGNAYARVFRRPAAVPIVPSLLLLVPGSLGVKSVASLLERDVVSGIGLAFTLVVFAGALAAGLVFANLALPPRRAL